MFNREIKQVKRNDFLKYYFLPGQKCGISYTTFLGSQGFDQILSGLATFNNL